MVSSPLIGTTGQQKMHRLYPLAAAIALALTACTPQQAAPEQTAVTDTASLWPEHHSPLPANAEKEQQLSQLDRKSTRLNSSHSDRSRMPSSA